MSGDDKRSMYLAYNFSSVGQFVGNEEKSTLTLAKSDFLLTHLEFSSYIQMYGWPS